MVKSLLLAAVFALLLAPLAYGRAVEKNTLTSSYKQRLLEQTLLSQQFKPVPLASDGYWKTLPDNMRKSYVSLATKYHGRKWEPISRSLFAEYKKNGNRYNYEKVSFEMRRRFACLVMAEIMEHQGRFMADITGGLHYFASETWWGVPAHYPADRPDGGNQVVDLFNAETASMLAWTLYMLHHEIETKERGLTALVKKEIQRRLLTPALTTDYDWKRRTSNWNPWISSNWLTCVLLCEDDRARQTEAVAQIMTCLDTFVDGNPDDGGCDEGVNYWDRAAGALMESLVMLDLASQGNINLSSNKKIQAMGAFVAKMFIGKGKFVNFADSYETVQPHANILYLTGRYLNNGLLLSYAATIAKEKDFRNRPALLFSESGNYPTLGRELLFLSHYQDFISHDTAEPHSLSEWLPDLQVCAVKSGSDTSNIFLSAKGGHNGESHNHNDVGNFVVYKDAEPLIIDIGVGSYTAQTFSNKRYELFNCRSAYHNVPLINGVEQRDGKQYRAKKVKYRNKRKRATFYIDLAEAYPQEACVDRWRRTVRLNRGKEVVVTEKYRLSEYRKPTEMVLVCCGEARHSGDGEITIDNGRNQGTLLFDASKVTPHIEKIDYQDAAIENSWQKRALHRIRLTVNSHDLKGKIIYTVK